MVMKIKLFIARHLRVLSAHLLRIARRLEFVSSLKTPATVKELPTTIDSEEYELVYEAKDVIKGYEPKR